ncbi:MAG TPA: BlaB/IND/MUS family subclass B1 metallo-beta-lactamase [Puia sp.]|nr:BlaB/IND/MUS family subclass B1 metallo-beta-lactamase [Puia sp.]
MSSFILGLIISGFTAQSFAQPGEIRLRISHLEGNFYIYTTFGLYKGSKITANGMYLITSKGAVIFDSPWDTTQFQPLLDSIQTKHHQKAIICIATHFHEDRTAGLEFFRKQGIKTFTTRKTDQLSAKANKKRAEFLISHDTTFKVGEYSFQTFYPGEGHTADNIVIWFEQEKILYGGCLIKSVNDVDLGNLSDANVKNYANAIRNVQNKCIDPKFVITGHDDWSSAKSLTHTLEMAEKLEK